MSEPIGHECGIALVRLLKPLSYYAEKYKSPLWGFEKLFLLMEKQHNRGQDGAGRVVLLHRDICHEVCDCPAASARAIRSQETSLCGLRKWFFDRHPRGWPGKAIQVLGDPSSNQRGPAQGNPLRDPVREEGSGIGHEYPADAVGHPGR